MKRMCRSNCRCPIPATVDVVVPISDEVVSCTGILLTCSKSYKYILSIMHILSVVRHEFSSLHRTLKCKYSRKWSRQKLETGEAQVQACSKRNYIWVISQKLNKIQQFAQKYKHVGWRQNDVSTKVGTTNAPTKGKANWTPVEQAAWVWRPIRSLEV